MVKTTPFSNSRKGANFLCCCAGLFSALLLLPPCCCCRCLSSVLLRFFSVLLLPPRCCCGGRCLSSELWRLFLALLLPPSSCFSRLFSVPWLLSAPFFGVPLLIFGSFLCPGSGDSPGRRFRLGNSSCTKKTVRKKIETLRTSQISKKTPNPKCRLFLNIDQ